MNKLQGIIISGFGGFYQVRLEDGRIINSKPRGRLKQRFDKIYAGDVVELSLAGDGAGIIETIAERRRSLNRPHIANVDQILIVLSWRLPDYDLLLLDRMLIISRRLGVEPLICLNKLDLLAAGEEEQLSRLQSVYEQAGYAFYAFSATHGEGIDALRVRLRQGLTVMAGPSGVGKSSLLNILIPGEQAEVGAVSERLRRGRHTTRYTRILPLPNGGMIADTPGFFIVELPEGMKPEELAAYYADFQRDEPCRFEGCLHENEPDCAVKDAVNAGEIDRERYQRYLRLLTEIREREVKYR
ncbi:MAG: ribosome small subunit-dependent GTPase A [Clostridia bacterium]|nr:ribosome small subunit-dependent GTPase A [Clostridia bacterium]